MLRKFTIFTALFFSTTVLALAANDVQVADITYFDLLTSDTAAATTITAAAGGQVTNFDVQSNYIDVTLDNLSTVTFNVAAASRYFTVVKQSGSNDYTVTPACITTTATLTGTGAPVVLRLQVQTTDPGCTPPVVPPTPPSGGSGGGGSAGHGSATPPVTPPVVSPTASCTRTDATIVPFSDIINHWGETYIDALYRRCIVDGKKPTLFAPDDSTTRAELVKIVLNTYNLGTAPYEKLFMDVFADDWFAGYVTNSAKRNVVIGYINPDGTSNFKPNQFITRAEALKVILRTKGITDFSGYTANFEDVKKGDWYYDYVAYAQAKGILLGYPVTSGKSGLVRDLYSFPHLLGPGNFSREVQNLKEILKQLGYFSGTMDQAYDEELTEAVYNYQTAKGIVPTGHMGEYTRTAILNETLVPTITYYFRPDTQILRSEISKIDILVENL